MNKPAKRYLTAGLLIALMVPQMFVGVFAGSQQPKKRTHPPKPSPAFELDPLRMVKNFSGAGPGSSSDQIGPNVILAMDTSLRMGYDYAGNYYDLRVWDKNTDAVAATDLGVAAGARYYRRKFVGLTRTLIGGAKYNAVSIEAIDELEPDYPTFFDISRLGMARDGFAQVVDENQAIVRFGLVRSRYGAGAVLPSVGNQQPVTLSDPVQALLQGDVGASGKWKVSLALTTTNNTAASASGSEVVVKAESSGASASVLSKLQLAPDASGGLLTAGADADALVDSPLTRLLEDTRAEVVRIMNADSSKYCACRNTVVVMVVGGKDGSNLNPVTTAQTFASVTAGGVTKPVPIYVVAIGPPASDVAQLQQIAQVSGGKYFEVQDADQIAYAASYAVQSAYRLGTDFNAGNDSEFQTVSPIIGSVELANAKDITGAALPDTIIKTPSLSIIPQRSNVVFTGGFTLPGFKASLRAFRVYKPVQDSTKASGYKFVKDGTRLWVASAPAATDRKIYTFIPGTGMVRFDSSQAAALRTYLRMSTDADAASLIDFVRSEPLGAIIDSTPAVMDPPSLEPPPDADYGLRTDPTKFAGARADRRTLVFYGGNDGMVHAIDGRLGKEVWAFVPFNLLPKLRTLRDGQGVDEYEFFVDSSPKVADVKVNGQWRTYLTIGQGPGGTFYQTFDVSDAGMGEPPESDDLNAVLSTFSLPSVIPLVWSFPRYQIFDHTISTTVTPWGDLGAGATAAEKTVGQTWSDPAVGQAFDGTGKYTMVVGSGYLGIPTEQQGVRGGVRAGTSLYLLDVETGSVFSSRDVGDDAGKNTLKNALQGDPTALGPTDTRFINQAYIGDTEGNPWRFNFSLSGSTPTLNAPVRIYDAKKEHPIYTSLALVNVGGSSQYIFFSTGMDIMPTVKKLAKFLLIGVLDNGGSGEGTKKFEIALDKADNKNGDQRPTAAPAVAGDVVFFTTTTEFPDAPCSTPEAELTALTYIGGPAYDTNDDDKVDKKDTGTIIKQALGRSTAAFVSDQHLYFGAGSNLEIFGDPEDFNNGVGETGVRILSWREVR